MNRLLVSFIILPISLACGCSMPSEGEISTSEILATDYCPAVIDLLLEFDAAIAAGMEDENFDAFPEIEATVQGIALIAIRAEREGLDLRSLDSNWLNELKDASRAFLALLDGNTEYLSEAEQRNIVANVLNDFEAAAVACTSMNA